MSVYSSQQKKWLAYDNDVCNVPWKDLLEYAHEQNKSPAYVIYEHRPPLCTDYVFEKSVERGVSFLRMKGLDKYASNLEGWRGATLVDFLVLNTEGDIMRDYCDYTLLKRAHQKGWIDLDAIHKNCTQNVNELFPSRPRSPFLGTLSRNLPLRRGKDKVRTESSVSSSTQEKHPNISSRTYSQSSEPIVRGPNTSERYELRNAIQRQFPQTCHYVSGEIVSTHLEENRVPGTKLDFPIPEPEGSNISLEQAGRRDGLRGTPTSSNQDTSTTLQGHRPRLANQTPSKGRRSTLSRPKKTPGKRQAPKKKQNLNKMEAMGLGGLISNPRTGRRAALTVRLPTLCEAHEEQPQSLLRQTSGEELDQQDQKLTDNTISKTASAGYNSIKASVRAHDPRVAGKRLFSATNFEFDDSPIGSSSPERPWARKVLDMGVPASGIFAPSKSVSCNDFCDFPNSNTTNELERGTSNQTKVAQKKSKKGWAEADASGDREESFDVDDMANMPYPEAENDSDYKPNTGRKKKPVVKKGSGLARNTRRKNVSFDEKTTRPVDGQAQCTTPTIKSTALRADTPGNKRTPTRVTVVIRRQAEKNTSGSSSSSGNDRSSSQETNPPTPCTPSSNKTEPLFGIDRKTPLSAPLGHVDRAFYAWSASKARFAAIAVRAQFAESADRIIAGDFGSSDLPKEFGMLRQLRDEFVAVEVEQKAQVARDAGEAEFAGCADDAVYAAQAEEAMFALNQSDMPDDAN
ncbi:hypothetical protein BGZ63DRAFT_168404 [Mariannaea sp. PMI_226]|nr:hypothetical protein BGZ63DRAFT_168404 [Mariannaea sp. PMI_226]